MLIKLIPVSKIGSTHLVVTDSCHQIIYKAVQFLFKLLLPMFTMTDNNTPSSLDNTVWIVKLIKENTENVL